MVKHINLTFKITALGINAVTFLKLRFHREIAFNYIPKLAINQNLLVNYQ